MDARVLIRGGMARPVLTQQDAYSDGPDSLSPRRFASTSACRSRAVLCSSLIRPCSEEIHWAAVRHTVARTASAIHFGRSGVGPIVYAVLDSPKRTKRRLHRQTVARS